MPHSSRLLAITGTDAPPIHPGCSIYLQILQFIDQIQIIRIRHHTSDSAFDMHICTHEPLSGCMMAKPCVLFYLRQKRLQSIQITCITQFHKRFSRFLYVLTCFHLFSLCFHLLFTHEPLSGCMMVKPCVGPST